ncbi:unnamed protein product, partial [Iphiclides podalirius]
MQSQAESSAPSYSEETPHPPVVTSQPIQVGVVIINQMGSLPASAICTTCNNQITTTVKRKPSMKTHLLAVLLCGFGCVPCVFIPYVVGTCNNIEHYCPNCNSYIGSYIQ